MEIKERILQEIEEASPLILEEFLDFILFTKSRRQRELNPSKNQENYPAFQSKIKAFEGLFDDVLPVSQDIDPDQEKWEYLKEKYNL